MSSRSRWGAFCVLLSRRPEEGADCCLQLEEPPKRADPAIYSQTEEIGAGRTPTWDSPDIQNVLLGGPSLGTFIRVRVTNRSPDVSAINVDVDVEMSDFGIGLVRSSLASRRISLAPRASELMRLPLPEELHGSTEDFPAFHVSIRFPTDRDFGNNEGAQALSAQRSPRNVPVTLSVPVRNEATVPRSISFETHVQDVSVPAPAPITLQPDEVRDIDLHITSTGSNRRVTLVATADDGTLVGGLTHILQDP